MSSGGHTATKSRTPTVWSVRPMRAWDAERGRRAGEHNGVMGRARLEAVQGDITAELVDAVVNAANRHLAGGGGVDGAIHRAAGSGELRAACAALGGCPPGEAKATPGFRLPARWIIHTVGPVWRGGGQGEVDTLASCYRHVLVVADELGATSVAIPAISTGAYGFPEQLAAEVAVRTVRDADTSVQLVRLVAFDSATLERYRRLIAAEAPEVT